jgi:hypothetical protein
MMMMMMMGFGWLLSNSLVTPALNDNERPVYLRCYCEQRSKIRTASSACRRPTRIRPPTQPSKHQNFHSSIYLPLFKQKS